MNAARAGAGLVILPHFLASQFSDLTPVLRKSVMLTRSWWLVVHESQRDVARVRVVMDFLVEQFGKYRKF